MAMIKVGLVVASKRGGLVKDGGFEGTQGVLNQVCEICVVLEPFVAHGSIGVFGDLEPVTDTIDLLTPSDMFTMKTPVLIPLTAVL